MPGKHSRMLRSSSQGEIGFFNHVRRFDAPTPLWDKRRAPAVVSKPVQNPVKMSNPSSAKPEQTRPRILTLGSPVKDSCWDIYENKGEGFLEACCYCKKKIGEKDEVLMYGYLGAFCSTECRHKQIALDKEVDKPLDPTEEATLRRWEKNLKNLFGAGAKTDAPS